MEPENRNAAGLQGSSAARNTEAVRSLGRALFPTLAATSL